MTAKYTKEFLAGWGQMDANGHLANTGYFDLAADVRLSFLDEHGFPPAEFRKLALGPVVKKEEIEYFREFGLHEKVTVTYAVKALAKDGSRYVIVNEFWNSSGERAAVLRSTGGWLDLRARKLVAPPTALLAIYEQFLPKTDDFEEIVLRK